MNDSYEQLMQQVREIGQLASVQELLEWDQDVCMPVKGVTTRAEQMALMAGLVHDRRTNPRIGEHLAALEDTGGDPVIAANIRETRRTYERAVRVPRELVREIARASTLAKGAWEKARHDDDFTLFAPHLSKLIELRRRQADLVGYPDEPYDALLDEYEPGIKTADVASVFERLQADLVPLVRAITASKAKPDDTILRRHYPRDTQETLVMRLTKAMGFDLEAGRVDVSTHPFTSGSTPLDVRLTTRYDEHFFPMAILGAMHEVGHGLYQQGLNPEHMFTPAGEFISLGIHESQSRLWENMVGRSLPFWRHRYADVQKLFPEALSDVLVEDFVGALNVVTPSFIRVEADEVTYNLHIILRFELERDLISGRLVVADIPEAWNAKMSELLGIAPANNREGCLQDIHWSMGVFGYFPTYALGNLYAAQFFAAANEQIPDLAARIEQGDLTTLLDWLRENIHRHGQCDRAHELVERVTGQPLTIDAFIRYVRDKFARIYNL